MKNLVIASGITDRGDIALDRYLSEISHYPLISIDEEIELAQTIREGGPGAQRAKDKLTHANLRFVVSVAKQYQHQGLRLIDLINEGNIGLLKAVDKFDDTRGFRFISYAVWWIRQSILQAIAEQSRIVRLPLNQVGAVGRINQAINEFEQKHLRKPSVQELADLTGIEEDKIRMASFADRRHTSIDTPLQEGEENTMSDMMPSSDDSRTDKSVDEESMLNEITSVLNTVLQDREITILKESFGIGCSEKALNEIGEELVLTRERVRQIREKAITKLRESNKTRILQKYLCQ